MTYINTGGEALFLGRHLTLPVSSDDEIARLGSVRYNPVAKCLQIAVDTEETMTPVEWADIKPAGNAFTGDGGEMRGDIEMVQGSRLLLTIGSLSNPSLSFMSDPTTGLAMLSMGTMSLIANSTVVANVAATGITVAANLTANTATIGSLTSPSANLISVNSSMATITMAEIDDLFATEAEISLLTTPSLTANSAEIWNASVQTMTANTLVANASTLVAANIAGLTANTITANYGIFHEFSVVPPAGEGTYIPTILLGESAANDWVISKIAEEMVFAYQNNVVATITPTTLETGRVHAVSAVEIGMEFALTTPSTNLLAVNFDNAPVATIDSAGAASFASIEANSVSISGSAIAHSFLADDENYNLGTVMVFGGSSEVMACETNASTAIAGVVAAPSALRFGTGADVAETVYIASTGRAMCKAVGPISRGEALMGSVTPGFAIVAPPGTSDTAIIGKAVTDLASGPGLVEIFMK